MTDVASILACYRSGQISEAEMVDICRAIEQHEAFQQEVSDAVRVLDEFITGSEDYKRGSRTDGVHLSDGRSVKFARFIIAKPDPLVEAMQEWWDADGYADIETFRAAIEKRGGKIVWGEKQ